MQSRRIITPALKWAGGKTQLLKIIKKRIPLKYNDYYEPFVGAGAVLFALQPQKAIINDINKQLINLYLQLQNAVNQVIYKVKEYDAIPCTAERYYANRKRYNFMIIENNMTVETAALLIWLNKHCFNGLYRVNKKGLFNVPWNKKRAGRSIDENNIKAIGEYLRSADIVISSKDFESACVAVKPSDFVYFDSPYIGDTTTFTDYSKNGFSLQDHERLCTLYKRLDKIGTYVMLSNHDVSLVQKFYAGYNIQSFQVKRMINRNANKRSGKEVLITNY